MSLHEHAERVKDALVVLERAFRDESATIAELEPIAQRLEEAIALKAAIDARFAWLAGEQEAGRRRGTTSPRDYLMRVLGISGQEASQRLRSAESLYGAIAPREIKVADFLGQEDPEAAVLEAQRKEQRRQEEERRKQAEARQLAAQVALEKQRVVEQELKRLNEHSNPGRAALGATALAEAKKRTPEDLRQWVRQAVRVANKNGRTPAGKRDHLAAYKKREFWMSRPDSDGGVKFGGYLSAGGAAVLSAALAPGRNAGVNTDADPAEDKRSLPQRRADQLVALAQEYVDRPERVRTGRASLVITGTARDFAELDENSRFLTNTGHELNPLEVLIAGWRGTDYALVMNDAKKLPLAFAQRKRTATFEQRMVLAAMELVCSCPGCEVPAAECDAHHLQAFIAGGRTDIENLTLLCRNHHTDNNDKRDGTGGLGHYERDPGTGVVGWQPPDNNPRMYNTTVMRERAPGARVLAEARQVRRELAVPPDTGAVEVCCVDGGSGGASGAQGETRARVS